MYHFTAVDSLASTVELIDIARVINLTEITETQEVK